MLPGLDRMFFQRAEYLVNKVAQSQQDFIGEQLQSYPWPRINDDLKKNTFWLKLKLGVTKNSFWFPRYHLNIIFELQFEERSKFPKPSAFGTIRFVQFPEIFSQIP